MKALGRTTLLAALAVATIGVHPAAAAKPLVAYATTGACNNVQPGGPCSQTSTLVQIDVRTGALVRSIGPVGYTVNGLAWDRRTKRLYASTAIGDVAFHGVITVDLRTGAGTPVDAAVHNFGLAGADSPIHSITIDSRGRMVGWYDEKPGPGVTDTFVTIDKATGVATEHPDTGIDTSQNGVSFDNDDRLWNVDTVRRLVPGGPLTQTAYRLDPATGKPVRSVVLTPPTMAALGDISPADERYYGLSFEAFNPATPTMLVSANLRTGAVTTVGRTVDDLHTLAFAR